MITAVDPGVGAVACADLESCILTRVWWANPLEYQHRRPGGWPTRDAVVIERPQMDSRSANVPPATLIDLTWSGLVVAMRLADGGARLFGYTPSEWKGSVPKPQHHLRIWDVLDPSERALFPAETYQQIRKSCEKGAKDAWRKPGVKYYPKKFGTHNLLDAAALGLYHVGRVDYLGMPA